LVSSFTVPSRSVDDKAKAKWNDKTCYYAHSVTLLFQALTANHTALSVFGSLYVAVWILQVGHITFASQLKNAILYNLAFPPQNGHGFNSYSLIPSPPYKAPSACTMR
jgi:hypothetical protein